MRLFLPPLGLLCCLLLTNTGWTASKTESIRAEFFKTITKEKVALDPRFENPVPTNRFELLRFSFQSERSQRVPGILLSQQAASGKRPAVIVMHGTGGSKESVLDLLQSLAARGFHAIAIDGRYHGERATPHSSGEMNHYNSAIYRAFQQGQEHPFYYDTVWDITRLVDLLQNMDTIDAQRIGLAGISKGGIESYLAAAMDPRIAVAVPFIGVQSFAWALEHNQWLARINTIEPVFEKIRSETGKKPNRDSVRAFYDRVVPGIYSSFDGPSVLPMIAPRPLLIINGDSDALTPLAGVRLSFQAASETYKMLGHPERAQLVIQENTPHAVTRESKQTAVEWFVRWLKPEPNP